ncbi:MAG: hypothetical protein ACREOH_23830, partial [Candidatus Entotheonellia bacterium]
RLHLRQRFQAVPIMRFMVAIEQLSVFSKNFPALHRKTYINDIVNKKVRWKTQKWGVGYLC